jgi:hypothetical protein
MQACGPKSFQSLLKLERRARIVPALEASEKTVRGDYEMGNPSLFNVLEIFDQTGRAEVPRDGITITIPIIFHLYLQPALRIPTNFPTRLSVDDIGHLFGKPDSCGDFQSKLFATPRAN